MRLTTTLGVMSLLLFGACAGPGTSPSPGGSPGPGASPPAGGTAIECTPAGGGEAASIVDFGFEPAQLSVAVGQAVTWTNNGAAPHTVTFDDGPDCGQAGGGGTISATFGAAGTYDYHCAIHPTMRGAVTVNP